MSDNVVYPKFRDEEAVMYAAVRDATLCNESVASGMKIAILELVKHEILQNMLDSVEA